MADRQEIIKGLEWWVEHQKGEVLPLAYSAVVETLEALKEQEAVKPKDIERTGDFATGLCPMCETLINKYDNAKACGRCGQQVKWND